MDSPERIYLSDVGPPPTGETYVKHVARYRLASMFVRGKVLDCACGSGYGAMILEDVADMVYGVDCSEDAIRYAKEHNSGKIRYARERLQEIDFAEEEFDSIVSLETIEHVSKGDAADFLWKVRKWLKMGGCFIGSSPMLRYKDGEPYVTNPHHVNEMPRKELQNLVNDVFRGWPVVYLHQNGGNFKPLFEEQDGFCIFIARKY